MRVLIIGNILRDIYLRLDERKESIEHDENDVKWINWGFNGSSHEFFKRSNILSGAVVSQEVLSKFGITAEIQSAEATNYRYILQADDQISYLVPSEKHLTAFDPSAIAPDTSWLFVDRSANLSQPLVNSILRALDSHPHLRLAFYAPKRLSRPAFALVERAQLIFADSPLTGLFPRGAVCLISEHEIRLKNESVTLSPLPKAELLTHLTTYSIIAASILGAGLRGKSVRDSLLYAKLNIENTRLDQTLPFAKLSELVEEEKSSTINLRQMASALVARGKGILAADESGGSIHKKFESMHIPDTFESRRDYRNLFFTTEGLADYVNGVILFDETARQLSDDGRNFVDFLTAQGIIPGIKVDLGLANLPGSTEKYTLGLQGLPDRLAEYYDMGLRFAKWRAAFEVSDSTPSKNAIIKNCELLASYALACQQAHIVPIVEPELVYDGDYSIETCAGLTGIILKNLFAQLQRQGVQLSATILKVNMILAGKRHSSPSSPEEVGSWTAKVLRRYCPKELAGVVFLSGGQSVEQATANLQAVTNQGPFPWPVTFSFARALQDPALEAWQGNNDNAPAARAAFRARLEANCSALVKNV